MRALCEVLSEWCPVSPEGRHRRCSSARIGGNETHQKLKQSFDNLAEGG
jgi:hypothetical protein